MYNFCVQVLSLVLARQLLANLWARQAALHWSPTEESLDLLIPQYTGSVTGSAIFDPEALSGTILQVKFRIGNAELAPRSIEFERDLGEPLPYLVLSLELGDESSYEATNSKIKVTASEPTARDQFKTLSDDWFAAMKRLLTSQKHPTQTKVIVEKLKKELQEKRLAMDLYNRYSISVRGASEAYGILKKADIVREFNDLLSITMPSPAEPVPVIQPMRPFEHLGNKSAWMSEYVAEVSGDDANEDFTDGDVESTGEV
jgi:hypothetical protein